MFKEGDKVDILATAWIGKTGTILRPALFTKNSWWVKIKGKTGINEYPFSLTELQLSN